jgi:hypothetical protein
MLAPAAGILARKDRRFPAPPLCFLLTLQRMLLMAVYLLAIVCLMCWNLFLHLKLHRESLERRELAVAFRQALLERRRPPRAAY